MSSRTASSRAFVAAALTIVVAGLLAGCGDDEGSDAAVAPQIQRGTALDGTAWMLRSYVDGSGSTVDAVASPPATLTFRADSVSGTTPCNNFTGTYQVEGDDELTIELGPVTEKACTDDDANAEEAAVLAALPTVASYSAGDDTLTLSNADGDATLVYDASTVTLEGVQWVATGVNDGNDALVSTALTENLTATFGADGVMTGSGGCNDFSAEYTTSGRDSLTIGPVASTRMACADDVTQAEAEYFTALGEVATYEINGTTLTLRDASGAMQVTYAARP